MVFLIKVGLDFDKKLTWEVKYSLWSYDQNHLWFVKVIDRNQFDFWWLWKTILFSLPCERSKTHMQPWIWMVHSKIQSTFKDSHVSKQSQSWHLYDFLSIDALCQSALCIWKPNFWNPRTSRRELHNITNKLTNNIYHLSYFSFIYFHPFCLFL